LLLKHQLPGTQLLLLHLSGNCKDGREAAINNGAEHGELNAIRVGHDMFSAVFLNSKQPG